MAGRVRAVALVIAISAAIAAPGADHEVQQVQGPHVVKHELGPFMEVTKGHKRQASGCLSCSLDGLGSYGYNSGYSTRSYGMGASPGMGAITRPQTSSSRQEVHSEQQYVNGQPVYQLQHERRYQDGRLVHNKRIEKDEDDHGYSPGSAGSYGRSQSTMTRSSNSGGRYGQDSHYYQPDYNNLHQSSHGSRQRISSSNRGHSSSHSQDQLSGNFEDQVSRMRENLRRQMSQGEQQPTNGGSQRSEYHSQSRYVNGKPVYESERELSYRDGQLVHNRTHEKGPEDLGTEDIAQQYDSNGALISAGSSSGGYYGNRQENQEYSSSTFQNNHNTYPSHSYSQRQNQPSSGYPYRRPAYRTYGSWESSSSYSNNGPISPYNEPVSDTSSTSYRENSSPSSSYPSYRPNSGSSSTTYREDSRQTAYPPHQRTSDRSSTRNREESSQSSYSSSYPSYRPTSGSSSTHNTDERRRYSSSSQYPSYPSTSGGEETSQSSSASYPSHRPATPTTTPDGLDVMLVQQNTRTLPEDRPNTDTFHQTSEFSYNRNEHGGNRQTYRPTGGHRGNRYPETSEEEEDGQYEQRRNEERGSISSFQPSVEPSDGGARTVAFDLSSSSSTSGTSFTDHLLQPNHSGRRHDTWDEDDLQHHTDDSEQQQQRVGIPGVINGPQTSTDQDDNDNENDKDKENKDRYDISPLDDGYTPTIPSVDNELESNQILVPSYDASATDSAETDSDRPSDHHTRYRPLHRSPTNTGSSSSSYHNRNIHSRNEGEETRQGAPSTRDRVDNLQTSSYDESRSPRPTTSSSRYNYNETRTHTSVTGRHQQQQPLPGSFSATSSSCSDEEGCTTLGVPQSNSRRNEIRTTRRYVNGHLVGMTTHDRQYINGALVHENRTDHGRDEVIGMNLGDTTNTQLDLTHGTYHPDSYSQQHEFRTEKKFVNGQQVYDLNHELRFEDGTLVYNNRTEKDEDELREEGQGMGHLGAVTSLSGNARQHVTQTQHHNQQVNYGSEVDGSRTRIFQDNQLAGTSQGSAVPTYSSRRYESRHEQEFVDGQPVYDLHHEQRYEDGSLVHENRTELREEDLVRGGYHDALHNILSGNTLATATQSYGRPSTLNHELDGGLAESSERNTHNSGLYNQNSASNEQSRGSNGQTRGSYDQRYVGHTSDSHSQTSAGSESLGTSLLTSGNLGSGRATTTILGGSDSLLTGSDSLRSISTNNDDHQGSTSRSFHSSTSQVQESGGSGSYNQAPGSYNQARGSYGLSADSVRSENRGSHSSSVTSARGGSDGSSSVVGSMLSRGNQGHGRATTTVLGASGSLLTDSDSSQRSLSGYSGGSRGSSTTYDSHSSTSQRHGSGGSGCLTCVLMREGNGHDSSSHGSSGSVGGGAGGNSHRREMSMEEHYENGQLIQGHKASREFRDGQLIHENSRSYSDNPESQDSHDAALSGHSSHYSSSSSSSSSSSGSGGADVCSPSPCQNGGTCLSGLYGPICTCPFGFSGTVCEEAECPRGYCRRGGQCSIKGGRHVCTCRPGFEGSRCQDRTRRRYRRHASMP